MTECENNATIIIISLWMYTMTDNKLKVRYKRKLCYFFKYFAKICNRISDIFFGSIEEKTRMKWKARMPNWERNL